MVPNARRALVVMAATLGFLVAGVSLLAFLTHAVPYTAGYPSVISQEAQLVFGDGALGHVLYILVQTATALVLYTGANTSFNGFPFLASFVAEDAFLPRQLRRRGHRLVFSNAIVVLTTIAVLLLIVTRAQVNALVPFYAIEVFTGWPSGFWKAPTPLLMASSPVRELPPLAKARNNTNTVAPMTKPELWVTGTAPSRWVGSMRGRVPVRALMMPTTMTVPMAAVKK